LVNRVGFHPVRHMNDSEADELENVLLLADYLVRHTTQSTIVALGLPEAMKPRFSLPDESTRLHRARDDSLLFDFGLLVISDAAERDFRSRDSSHVAPPNIAADQ